VSVLLGGEEWLEYAGPDFPRNASADIHGADARSVPLLQIQRIDGKSSASRHSFHRIHEQSNQFHESAHANVIRSFGNELDGLPDTRPPPG